MVQSLEAVARARGWVAKERGARSLGPRGQRAAETRTAGRAVSREGPRQEGGRSRSTSQGEARRKARVTSHRHSEKFLAGGAGRVGSDSAATRRCGTRAGKFLKPRKPAGAPWGGNWPSCSAHLLFPGTKGGKRSTELVSKLKVSMIQKRLLTDSRASANSISESTRVRKQTPWRN